MHQVERVAARTAAGQTLLNSWIEFGNRLLNFPLVAIAGLAFIAFFLWHRQQKAGGRGTAGSTWCGCRRCCRLASSRRP